MITIIKHLVSIAFLVIMRKQFQLRLCNYMLYGWLGFIGMMASIALAGFILTIGNVPRGSWQFITLLLIAGSGFYCVYRLLKEVAVYDTLVTVESDQLTISFLSDKKSVVVVFAEVISYRDEFLRDGRELRFRLHSGKKVKLATNSFLGPTGDYDGLLQAVQGAITEFNVTRPVVISREKSFFEKPFATILLLAASLALVLAAGDMIIKHKPLKGNFISAIGALLSYASIWYAARARQRQS